MMIGLTSKALSFTLFLLIATSTLALRHRYLAVLMAAGIFPFLLSFYPRLRFYRHMKALGVSIGLIVVLFGAWDVLAAYRGHWYFDPQGVGEVRIVNLPLEEWLFFIVIPFCCIFTWEAVNYFKNKLK